LTRGYSCGTILRYIYLNIVKGGTNMLQLTELTIRRDEIIKEISGIRSMRKGVLNTTYQKVAHKNGEVAVKGPYYVLSRKGAGGKTVSRSIPAAEAPYVQQEVDNYKRFRKLSDEFVEICEKVSVLNAIAEDECKKN
jgi:hypothetical protein